MAELGDGFRCIAPTWPLGAHSTPTDGADLGAEAAARRIVHFMEALDLTDVTVVANDTGGGLVLASLGDPGLDTSRIARLVLTNCDSYEHFPPGSFAQIVKLCRVSSRVGGGIVRLLATGPGQSFFLKAVSKHPPSRERQREIFGAFATSGAARRDAVTVTASLDPALTLRAATGDRGVRQTGHPDLGHRGPAVPPRPRPPTTRRVPACHLDRDPRLLGLRHARCARETRSSDPQRMTDRNSRRRHCLPSNLCWH